MTEVFLLNIRILTYYLSIIIFVAGCIMRWFDFSGSAAWVQARCCAQPDAGEPWGVGGAPLAAIFCRGRGPDDVPKSSKVKPHHRIDFNNHLSLFHYDCTVFSLLNLYFLKVIFKATLTIKIEKKYYISCKECKNGSWKKMFWSNASILNETEVGQKRLWMTSLIQCAERVNWSGTAVKSEERVLNFVEV